MTTIAIDVHDRICQDLHQQIRSLIVENEKLRAALAERDNYAESASLLAQAVVLAEREKCAQLVETYEKAGNMMNAPEYAMVFKDCAAAIRARGRQ